MRYIQLVFAAMYVGSAPACTEARTFDQLAQQTYIKAHNTNRGDSFGSALALSGDGSTLAVGAPREDSAAGAVYVFVRDRATWRQEAYVQARNTGADDKFGTSVALSRDGSTLAVGATDEDSLATGINSSHDGDDPDPNAPGGSNAGAVYVFTRTEGKWTQQAYVKSSSTAPGDAFGSSVTLSDSGSTLTVGAPQAMNFAGAVHVFTRTGTVWSQEQSLGSPSADPLGQFGSRVALSGDGATLAVGAPPMGEPGAVYVFARSPVRWALQAPVVAPNADPGDRFGNALALSTDGATLAVGAMFEASAAKGIDGDEHDQADNMAARAGAVYLFTRTDKTWAPPTYFKASNTSAGDRFGISVALSHDGSKLVVGAVFEDSSAKGVNRDQEDDSVMDSGAAYVFARSDALWRQRAYVKASNTRQNAVFGCAVALSLDGAVIAVGAMNETSAAVGVDGDQDNEGAPNAGAAYVFLEEHP